MPACPLDQARAEACLPWRLELRYALLLPAQADAPAAVALLDLPRHMHAAVGARQCAIFGGVGRQFVQDQAKAQALRRRQRHGLALDLEHIRTVDLVNLERLLDQLLQISPAPVRIEQETVRARQRR